MYHRLGSGVDLGDLEERARRGARGWGRAGTSSAPPHTLAKFETAFFAPKLLDNTSFEQWTAEGALDANQRGLRRAAEMLRSYEPPPMDEAGGRGVARVHRQARGGAARGSGVGPGAGRLGARLAGVGLEPGSDLRLHRGC